ncbi:MAG: hypothetical protein M3O30_17000 [Planctomycetota bacterium]|nr:hypothetical protein [Planctomycetota bacterium]
MKPLPRAASGSVISLDADLYNYIAENLERLDKWTVKPPLNFQQTPAGNLLAVAPSPAETVLVAIIGAETGGGRYQGSILYGPSTGAATDTFQLDATLSQAAFDGPVPKTDSHGLINNALVMNMWEPYGADSHMLYNQESAHLIYALGRIEGSTNENPPRTRVYIENWPQHPVIVKITKDHTSTLPEGGTGGVYLGQILQGRLDAVTYFSAVLPAVAAVTDVLPANDNCWVVNNWEQNYVYPGGATAGETVLPVGTIIWGFASGWYLQGSSNKSFRVVHTWFPPQMPLLSPTIQFIQTTNTAGGTYSGAEELMLNSLKTDVTNLRASLLQLYTNLKNAGYSK